jgi:hypothetical protein
MMPSGVKSKCSRISASIRASGIRWVPKQSIETETGSTTPIAHATWTSQREARPAATTFLATQRAA